MPLQLDDGQEKKELLDLSKLSIDSREELDKAMEKIPEYKTRPDKVVPEDIAVKTGNFSFKSTKAEIQQLKTEEFPFRNPVPISMQGVNIQELSRVDISWRMLTTARPSDKFEEDLFSRFIELSKLKYKTALWEKEQCFLHGDKSGRDPNAAKSRATGGTKITETRIETCRECGEEMCSGMCKHCIYDYHARIVQTGDEGPVIVPFWEIKTEPDPNSKAAAVAKKSKGTPTKPASTTGGGAKPKNTSTEQGSNKTNKRPDSDWSPTKGSPPTPVTEVQRQNRKMKKAATNNKNNKK